MSDIPERIFRNCRITGEVDAEYIRSDLAQAMVAAALEKAAWDVHAECWNDGDGGRASDVLLAEQATTGLAIRAIKSSTPTNARAALDAMLAKAWEEGEQAGLRKAGAECHAFMLSLSNDIPPVEHTDIDTCIILRHRIEALIDRTAEGKA